MFSKRLFKLIALDFFSWCRVILNKIISNFWPDPSQRFCSRKAKNSLRLFFFDYIFFKKIVLFSFSRLIKVTVLIACFCLLFHYLGSSEKNNLAYLRVYYFFVALYVFFASLSKKSWVSYFLSFAFYVVTVWFFYKTFSLEFAFLLWIFFFFTFREFCFVAFNELLLFVKRRLNI